MKRPGVAEKQAADPEHEPDFYKISETNPVPEKSEDESILLQCTVQGGPKARMPIYSGDLKPLPPMVGLGLATGEALPVYNRAPSTQLTPRDQTSLSSFQHALGASENQFKTLSFAQQQAPLVPQTDNAPAPSFASNSVPALNFQVGSGNRMSALAAANRLAFTQTSAMPDMAAAQFAAGFAAATVLSQQQLRNVLSSFSFTPQPQQSPQGMPSSMQGIHFTL